MAKVKIQGHASGTGILTVTAPNTSTDRTITLPDATGTLLNSDGDGSSLTGVGVAGITSTADATAITIDSSENVGIDHSTGFGNYDGTGVKYAKGDGTLFVGRDGGQAFIVNRETDQGDMICLNVAGSSKVKIGTVSDGLYLGTGTGGNTKQLTITSGGRGVSDFTAFMWCRMNGSGTPGVYDGHNVSSITDNATGSFRMNFTVNASNNLYSAVTGKDAIASNAGNAQGLSFNVAYLGIENYENNSKVDSNNVTGIVFGDS